MLKFSAYQDMGGKGKKERKKMTINISRYVLQFTCFPVQNMPSSGVLVAHR